MTKHADRTNAIIRFVMSTSDGIRQLDSITLQEINELVDSELSLDEIIGNVESNNLTLMQSVDRHRLVTKQSVKVVAEHLGISRPTYYEALKGNTTLSPEGVRAAKEFIQK